MDLNDTDIPLDRTQLRVYLGTLMSIIEMIKLDKNMSMDKLVAILLHNAKEAVSEIKGIRDGMNERH